jgi:hypothetical protein
MKIFFTILSAVIGTIAFYPYVRDIFFLKTKPHAYTWLIWSITQGTAVVGILYGGGGWGGLNLVMGTLFVMSVFLFSLRYGTKNITKTDTAVLIAALLAVVIWWQLHEPILAIFMVSAIDILGYIPSFRKSYHEPWSETLVSWLAFVASDVFALFALSEYNFLTMTYIVAIIIANLSFFIFCLSRRHFVLKPKS